MTRWTEFIKEYAKEHNLSYGCALSDPKCVEAYKAKKNKPIVSQIIPIDDEYRKNKYRFRFSRRELRQKIKNKRERKQMGFEDVNRSGYRNEIYKLLDELRLIKKDWISKNFYISNHGAPLLKDENDNIRPITNKINDIQKEIIKLARDHNEIPKKYLDKKASASYKGDYIFGLNTFYDLNKYFNSHMNIYKMSRDIIYSTDIYNEQVSKYLSKNKKLDKRQIGVLDKLKSRINEAQNKYDDYIELILIYMTSIIDSPAFGIVFGQKFRGLLIDE
jgi:hypothetical protein